MLSKIVLLHHPAKTSSQRKHQKNFRNVSQGSVRSRISSRTYIGILGTALVIKNPLKIICCTVNKVADYITPLRQLYEIKQKKMENKFGCFITPKEKVPQMYILA